MGNGTQNRARATRLITMLVTTSVVAAAGLAVEPQGVHAAHASPTRRTADATREPATYHPLTPARILDTREGLGIPARLDEGVSADLVVTGRGGVPADGVAAVVLNVTATNATGPTYVTAWPAGTDRPLASNLNVVAGQDVPNLVIVPVGTTGAASGKVSLYNNHGSVDLVADVEGWFPAATGTGGSEYTPLSPTRIMDTRLGLGVPTSVAAHSTVDLQVTGHGGVPATGVGAVVINLTATNPTAASYVTAWPTGVAQPVASNLNVVADQTSPNLVIVPVGTGADAGKVSFYNNAGTLDLVADVEGWFPVGSKYSALAPTRILDSRGGLGISAALSGATSADLQVAGKGGVPATGVAAVVLNVTATNPTASTYVTVWPTGVAQPNASNLNVVAGQTAPNLVIVPVGTDGKISLYSNNGTTDLVADVQGWFPVATQAGGPVGTETGKQWRFSPPSVLLAPGETRIVDLLGVDTTGASFAAAAAGDVAFSVVGSGVTYRYLGDNEVELVAGDAIGAVTIAARPDGTAVPAALTASVVVLGSGVTEVADDDVLFPPLYVDSNDDPLVALGSLADANGVAGFTWAELQARTYSADQPVENVGGQIISPDARFPLVVAGAPPAAGSLLITGGGSGVSGRVVEPDGLPTIERNGNSLVSVAMVALGDLYASINYSLTGDDMRALGLLVETQPAASLSGLDALTAGSRRSARATAGEPPAKKEPPCKIEAGYMKASIDLLTPSFHGDLELIADSDNDHYKFLVTMSGRFDLGMSFELQPNAQATCDFPLTEKVTQDIPPPLGPLSLLVSGTLSSQVVFNMTFKLRAGPRAKVAFSCYAGLQVTLGFESTPLASRNLSGVQPIKDCPTKTAQLGFPGSPGSVGIAVDISGGPEATIDLGGRIGGSISRALGRLFNDPDLGVKEMVEFDLGLVFGATFETQGNTVFEKKASSQASLNLSGSSKVNAKGIDWMQSWFKNSAGNVKVGVWSGNVLLVPAFKAANSTGFDYSVNGGAFKPLALGGTLYVEEGDHLQVKSKLDSKDGNPRLSTVLTSNPFRGVPDKEPGYHEFATGDPQVLGVEADITAEMCGQRPDPVNGVQIFYPQTTRIVGDGDFNLFGWDTGAPAPVWGGQFDLKCAEGKMAFEPDTVTGHPDATVNLKSHGGKEADWFLEGVPDWLDVSPKLGTWGVSAETDEVVPITLTPNREPANCDEPVPVTITAKSSNDLRGTTALVFTEKDPCYVNVTPASINTSGTTLAAIKTLGLFPDHYTFNLGSIPDWVQIDGDLEADLPATDFEQLIPFSVTILHRDPLCEPQLAENATILIETESRGTARLKVILPKVPRDPRCVPVTGAGQGDPHMHSFDGGYYEGQVRGEFVYARSKPGADADVEVRVRQQPSRIGAVLYPVTSITATVVRVGEHKVEVYARDEGPGGVETAVSPPMVYVDGVLTDLPAGQPLEVTDGFSIVRNGNVVEFNAPYVHVTTSTYSAIMDTTVAADLGAPIAGLLGTPNGTMADDFTPSTGGASYTLQEIQTDVVKLRAFTGSWKIDPANTLFTQDYVGNNDPDPTVDPAEMAMLLQQAEDLLDGLSTLCDVQGAIDNHLLDGLALELGIGRTSKELAAYSCQYVVRGAATSGDSPIPGLDVSVNVPGLTPCTTTTGSDGRYQCVLTPDYDPASGDPTPAAPPWNIDVEARFAGSPAVIASNSSVVFDHAAEVSGQPVGAFVDLSIDPSLLPNLNVSGTMLQAGQPYPDPVSLTIRGYDASDHLLVELLQTVTPDPVDGSYEFTEVLPVGATHASIVAAVGLQCCPATDYPTVAPSGLHNGPNAVPFSFDDDPPIVGFTGTMTGIGGAALAGPITVFYQTYNGPTVVNSDFLTVNPAGNDGSYTIPPIRMPRTATSVKVTAQVGVAPSDYPMQTFAIAPGPSTKTFNASYIPPTLSISGNLTKAAVGLTGPVDVGVTSFSASNVQLGSVQVIHITSIDPTTGAYAVAPFAIPVGAERVSAHAQLGVIQTPFTTRELTNIPATGNSALDMSFDFNPPVVTVTGIAKKNGSPYTQQFGLQLLSFFGVDLFTQQALAVPDANGHYSATFEAPMGTFKIRAIAQIGPVVNEYPTTADITTVMPGAQNVPFDIDYNTPEVVVSGNLTDAAGNAMPAGQRVELTAYDDTTGTHQIFTTSVNVDPDAGAGHYSVSLTVPTTTQSVRPAVRLGPLSDTVSGPLAQVVIGHANQITLDAVYNPPILTLHGTMTQPGGTPYTGAIFIRVQSKDSGGALLADQFWTAHLDANGFYNDINVTLPMATTSVVITPQAGSSQNWVPVTKTVVPGVNDFLLDVVQNLPRLHLNGTAKRNDVNINTSFGVKIEALNGSGAVLQTLNTGVTANNGAYSLTWDAPLTTVSARVTADVSPFAFDDVVQTFTSIQNGVNELTLDFDDSSKHLQMSGTVTSDGVPYHGVVTFYVNYGHGSPRVQDVLQPYGVSTDVSGHYTFDEIIPDASTQAFIDAMVPTGFGGSTAPVSTQVTGMTALVNTLAFDPAYVPLHLLLSGTITVDGTPPSGTVPVLISILTDNNQTFTKTVQVDPDDVTGHYDLSVAEPFDAVTATATIEVGPAYDWFVSDPIALSASADTPATFDAIYDPVYLSFTGRIRDLGVAADDITFTVSGVTGNTISSPISPGVVVTPDGTGAFGPVTMAVPYPRTADSLQVSVNYHLVGEGVQRHQFGTGVDIADPPHDETLTVTRDTQSVVVTGVTVDGTGVPHNYDNLAVSTSEYDAQHDNLGGSGFTLGYDDTNGSFTLHLEPNQNAATIDISIGGGPAVTVDVTHNVDAFHTTADIGDYAIVSGATLRISGGFTMGENPDTGEAIGPDSMRIVVTPYIFSKDDWQASPPYVHNGPSIEIAPGDVIIGDRPGHPEEFFTTTLIPADTNLIDVQYFVDDDPVPYRSGYVLDPNDQNPLVQYFDYGGPEVQNIEFHTTFGHYDAGPPASCGIYTDSPFIVHISAYTYVNGDPDHNRSVFNGFIVPDPDDPDAPAMVTIRVPVEPGHDKIDFSDDTTAVYTDSHMSWSGGTGQMLEPGNTIATFVGRGCNPFNPQP